MFAKTQRVTGRGLGYFCIADSASHVALDHSLVGEVTAALLRLAVCIDPRRRKNPWPSPVGRGAQVHVAGRTAVDETGTLLQIGRVHALHPTEVFLDRLKEFDRTLFKEEYETLDPTQLRFFCERAVVSRLNGRADAVE